jgi:hypothetical protein
VNEEEGALMIKGEELLSRTHLVSYATARFESVRRDLNESAYKYGISRILSYRETNLHSSSFYKLNRSILDEVCGAGYWAWKPFFIQEAMRQIRDDEIIIYCDAGSKFLESPEPLLEICMNSSTGIVLFDARPLSNRQFTKRDCFVRMECDGPKYWNANIVIATIILLRKSVSSMALVDEWLKYCCDRAAITDDPNLCGLPELEGYAQHRWDQAILSILAAKYSLETFRNPTMWGNFLKLPEFRVQGEEVTSPYGLIPWIEGYSPASQVNSPYGTIFEINRMPNHVGKKPLVMPTNYQKGRRRSVLLSRLRRLFSNG